MGVQRGRNLGTAVHKAVGVGADVPGQGVIEGGRPTAGEAQHHVFRHGDVGADGFIAMADKQPPAFPILPQLVQQAACAHAGGGADIHLPLGFQGLEHG